MSAPLTATLRILEPYPGIFAYYDGRIEGKRLWSEEKNWLDDGAYALGVASYAVVSQDEALVYDTHISLDHAKAVRDHLDSLGVRSIRVVLSHWHTDHIAGNAVFADCEIIANRLTAEAMRVNEAALAQKTPPLSPVVMPTTVFDERMSLRVGALDVDLRRFDIHSADGTVMLVPAHNLLLAGDTLEDTITYLSEPEGIARHLAELDRLAALPFDRILPNHGSESRIAAGGYEATLIDATKAYLSRLTARVEAGADLTEPLSAFVDPEVAAGWIDYYAPYEVVHRQNIAMLQDLHGSRP